MNPKPLFAYVLFALMTFVAPRAFAQEATPEHSSKLSPEAASCLRACLGGAKPAEAPQCGGLDAATKGRVEQLAAQISTLRGQVGAQAAKIADHERRIKELEGKVGLLGDKDAELQRQIDSLVKDLGELVDAMKSLQKQYDLLLKDYVDLDVKLGAQILGLQQKVDDLTKRVDTLESKMSYAKLGFRVGVLVLPAFDGSTYSGFSFGPRLTLNLTEKSWLAVDTNLLLADSSHPVGMNVRGGVGYDFHPNWYVTGGFGSTWVNYDSRLKAQAAYLTPDVGLGFRSGWFDASAHLMAGPKFGHGDTSGVVGGGLFLGGTF